MKDLIDPNQSPEENRTRLFMEYMEKRRKISSLSKNSENEEEFKLLQHELICLEDGLKMLGWKK